MLLSLPPLNTEVLVWFKDFLLPILPLYVVTGATLALPIRKEITQTLGWAQISSSLGFFLLLPLQNSPYCLEFTLGLHLIILGSLLILSSQTKKSEREL